MLEEAPNMNWQQLKQQLLRQYSDEGEAHLALLKLTRLRQAKRKVYKIMSLAGEAHVGQNLEILVEDVSNDAIAK